jgi:DNA-binding NtrC family response regulator
MKLQNIKTVLLIDDDAWVAKGLQQVLQRHGFVVHTFNNGKHGLELLAKISADLVITDIFMDNMDGVEIVTALKKFHPKIKIIAMSGGSRMVPMDLLPVAKILGADRTLPKPVEMTALLNVIAELDAELAD